MLLDLTCWLWYNITSSPIFLLVECWMLMSHESWVISHKLYLVYTLVSNYWVSKWNFYLEFVHNFVKTISTTSIEGAQRLYTRQDHAYIVQHNGSLRIQFSPEMTSVTSRARQIFAMQFLIHFLSKLNQNSIDFSMAYYIINPTNYLLIRLFFLVGLAWIPDGRSLKSRLELFALTADN